MHTTKKLILGFRHLKLSLCVVTVFCVAACSSNTEVIKTIEYYGVHLVEADTVNSKCKDMEKQQLSAMSPSQRLAWEETPMGINCRNAQQALSDQRYLANQKKMRETADKY